MKKTFKIRLFSVLAALAVCIGTASPGIASVMAMYPAINVITRVTKAAFGGYSDDYLVDEKGNIVDVPPSSFESGAFGTLDTVPTEYDARDYGVVTAVKDQGNSSSCWAFAGTAAIESYMVKKGYETISGADYSEAHLIWFAKKQRTTDVYDPTYGDGVDYEFPFDEGGNWFDFTFTYARGSGAELELNKPFYGSRGNFGLMECSESDRYVSYARLTDTNVLAPENESINPVAVKASIMEGGSVVGSYYHNASRYTYGAGYTSYYQTDVTGSTNHAVLIVGWDDSYPTSRFNTCVPPSAGAWLCKNSWGDGWGDGGYFWLSYKEPSLKNIVSYKAAPTGVFDNIYQYDGAGWSQALFLPSYSTAKTANIFTASEDEILTHVAFSTPSNSSVDYEINIYLNVSGTTDPTSGTRVNSAKTSGSLTCTGYHTVELATAVELTKGQRFSVVVTMTDTIGQPMQIPVEGNNTSVYCSVTGVSFMGLGTTWYDTSSMGYNNACVKAMTRDYTEEVTVSPAPGSSTVIDDENGYIYGLSEFITAEELENSIEVTGEAHIQPIGSGLVHTGLELYVVSDEDSSILYTYTVVIFGDINGDGIVTSTDLIMLKSHIAGSLLIEDGTVYKFAVDFSRDNIITQTDYTLLKSVMAGSMTINQTTGTVM